MARPKSDDRRKVILEAAAHVIASHGLGAPTALIAKEAGVSNGSLFTYFSTKRDLFNQLYVDLKLELASAASDQMPKNGDLREQLAHMWSGWLEWALANGEKRRALAQLSVSDEISSESKEIGHRVMAGMSDLVDRCRENGPMRAVSINLVANILNSVADATFDFITIHPHQADEHGDAAFQAVWRMLN